MPPIRPGVGRLFRLPVRRPELLQAEVDDEIAFHIEARTEQLVAAGMPLDEARLEAARRFARAGTLHEARVRLHGSATRRERRMHVREWLHALWQDARLAARGLRRTPGFTLAVVLTLGLGLGGTVAMFSVVDAVLLRALPLPEPDRVVALVPQVGAEDRGGSPGLLTAWGARSRQLRTIAGLRTRDATLIAVTTPERVPGASVSGGFFGVLRIAPALGRAIGPADDAPGAPPVVVLSHALWTRAFDADTRVVGRPVRLDGALHTVVGVMPPALDAVVGDQQFWTALALDPSQRENYTPYLTLIGRLASGATPASATRELDAIIAQLGEPATVDGAPQRARVLPAAGYIVRDYRQPLVLMLGAVAVVLGIACANVATLVLARSVGRVRELAVRASLGAGRGRLLRQLAAEHLVLGALATAVALPVAALGTRALIAAVPAEVPRLAGAGLDTRALMVALALGLLASVLCGLAPALHQRRLDIRRTLQGAGRGVTDRRGERWRRWLVGAEVALAVVLLVGAGLLVRSALALGRVRPGFDVAQVLTARLALPERDYPALPQAIDAYQAILDATRAQPGVTSAALVSRVPLGGSMTSIDVARADQPFSRETKVNAALRLASPQYFRSMGIPVLAGRDLRDGDDARAVPVIVVNATLARRLGGETSVVGRRIRSDNGAFADGAGRPRELEIVGVVGDVRDGGPRREAGPEFFAPLEQVSEEPWNYWIGRELVLVARTPGVAAAAAPALRRAVASVDPRVPLYDVQSTGERLGGALAVERFSTRLLALLGAFGLALAALGIHGVVAYAASQRTREVGIRMALGAPAAHAMRLVVRQGMRPVVAGLVVGVAAAVVAARAAAGLLFGISPLDPITLLGAMALLASVGALACYGPARRIARVDPASSLRNE